jgi:hypothetical protein
MVHRMLRRSYRGFQALGLPFTSLFWWGGGESMAAQVVVVGGGVAP